MGVFASYKGSSLYQKISFSLIFVAAYLAWTSFLTAAWGDGYVTSGSPDTLTGYGLWRRCGESDTSSDCSDLMGWNLEWYRTMQAFAVLGFVCVNVSVLLLVLRMFVPKCGQNNTLTLWTAFVPILSALCYLVAIIVFAVKFDSAFEVTGSDSASVQYGWGLAIGVLVLDLVVGCLMGLEARRVGAQVLDL